MAANVYVRSHRAGERLMALLRRLYGGLQLTINETRSASASAFGRKFLGYELWLGPKGELKRGVAAKPMQTFKQRIRELTRRWGGRSMGEMVQRLRLYLLGWKAYFRLGQTPKVWRKLDGWLRHRLRAIQLKQWKQGTTPYRELIKLDAQPWIARKILANSRSWWRNSSKSLNNVMPIAWFDGLGLPRLSGPQSLELPGADPHAGWCGRGDF